MTFHRFLLLASLPLLGVLAALLLLTGTSADDRGRFIPHPETAVTADELVVQFRPGISDSVRNAILRSHGVTIEREMLLEDFVIVNVSPARRAAIGQSLMEIGAIETVEEVGARVPASIPNDPDYDSQWHLEVIGVEQAYDVSNGNGVIVAVLDTGVAYENHADATGQYAQAPDLAAAGYVSPWDVYGNDEHANDDYGHGTHVSGTIAQKTNNGIGGAGVAPGVRIMPVKVCGPTPDIDQPYACQTAHIAEGITWAVDHGARIINLSLGGGPGITEAERAALRRASEAGVVVIASAGNLNNPVLDFPAAVPSVISVGAVGRSLTRAGYSNYGTNEQGGLMDLVAPGGDPAVEGLASWTWQESYGNCFLHAQPYNSFGLTPCAGTSMAAAHVTGVAALIRARFPQLNVSQVRQTLRECALDLGADGEDPFYGWGLVHAGQSLRDLDADDIPDCIDPVTITPSPTPVTPPNECNSATSPTVFPTPAPATQTGTPDITQTPRPTASPTQTGSGQEGSETPTATPTETATEAPSDTGSSSPVTDTPILSPTEPPTPTPTPTPSPTPTASPTPSPTPEPSCGDVDCSGQVNALDSLGVMRWLAQTAPFASCLGKGHVNCDPHLNQADVVVILRFAAGLPPKLPAGCPGIG